MLCGLGAAQPRITEWMLLPSSLTNHRQPWRPSIVHIIIIIIGAMARQCSEMDHLHIGYCGRWLRKRLYNSCKLHFEQVSLAHLADVVDNILVVLEVLLGPRQSS